ncbi:NAD(P)/FAD-dependent oxidoreductase [Tepidiphilus succinatimandens]|uniref:NAD(P)/FAD-dependent oxidoreductase n=1 Tax=Tepidiphilus succinatimandens TaxID=224436 RepID=UPI00112F56DF|nr:FAD-dependent oxidoreductase [Tepidiphilus succinatimandens]
MKDEKILIIGAGLAGVSVAHAVGMRKYDGEVILLDEEGRFPYDRPSLSKDYLKGKIDQSPFLVDINFFQKEHVLYLSGKRAVRLLPSEQKVILDNDESLSYSKLVIATGMIPRRIQVPGSELKNVFYLRTYRDATELKSHMTPGRKIVILGGGLIGCEVASTVADMGLDVTIVESRSELLECALSAKVGAWLRGLLERKGVSVQLNTQLREIRGESRVEKIITDKDEIPCDLVLVSIGSIPNDALARAAGLKCDNGILVDDCGRTSEPNIFSLGDVANWPLKSGGRRPLGTYINTQQEAEAVAATLMGTPMPSPQVPKFWTDIAGQFIQVTGDINGEGEYWERGSLNQDTPYLLFRVKEGRALAVLAANASKDYSAASRIAEAQMPVTRDTIVDPAVNLRDLLRKK